MTPETSKPEYPGPWADARRIRCEAIKAQADRDIAEVFDLRGPELAASIRRAMEADHG